MPYPQDPGLRAGTLELLGSIWKKLPDGVRRARGWGADWMDGSEPFVAVEGGRVVAHVGVIEIPVVLDGREETLAGVHAVCTAPEQRGRGLLRATMERALAWIDGRHARAVLWANDPAIYARFGFVAQPESVFRGPLAPARGERRARRLSLDDPADLALLRDRLARRAPVSTRYGSRDPGWLFLVNLGLWPVPALDLVPELDCIAVHEQREGTLYLHDVIAERMPPLAELAARLGSDADRVEVSFSPDALAAPWLTPGATPLMDFFMVRGDWPLAAPFALSPLSRC